MSVLDDLSKIRDYNIDSSNNVKSESLISKYNIPIDHFEFEYVEKCNDGRELEKILHILRSGEEGYYPDLLKCTENRLRIIKPKSKFLREVCPVLNKKDLDKSDVIEISKDLENFVVIADKRDKELERRRVKTVEHDSDIRKYEKLIEETKISEKRINSTDYKSWDKYDPDTEILKMDIEEEKAKKEALEMNDKRIEKEKLKKPNKTVTFNQFGTEAEAAFFSERERETGNEYFKIGDFEQALQCYSSSIQSKTTINNLNNRAVTYLKLKRYEEAVKDCDKVLAIEKDNVKAHTRKAEALEKLEKYEELKKSLTKSEKRLMLNLKIPE
ncbi:sperm-associated antigen 1 [Diorhabda sublineata]|uniref:sperm-associated antigen 1 n=1 Tax=Diorhabda sublineata TaxID=1163346 RepID=UPI0024E04CF1|nr:sperm-associated antigen 1 [Diorhabda sublineata]